MRNCGKIERRGSCVPFLSFWYVFCSSGSKPMKSPDGEIILCFNGEICNRRETREEYAGFYDFLTEIDCEVIVIHPYVKKGSLFLFFELYINKPNFFKK
jgi:asparagine synthetase B (glutamine-hydrolysing)